VGRVIKILLLTSLISLSLASPAGYAQGATKISGPRKQLATIIFSGLAGAVLGLSTLSFYGRPQDRLANVPIGFAVGVIVGTGYTTYKAATSPRSFYGDQLSPFPPLTENRFASPTKALGWGYSWTF
jgi:hypothetical protein